jgi:hypothetical protein
MRLTPLSGAVQGGRGVIERALLLCSLSQRPLSLLSQTPPSLSPPNPITTGPPHGGPGPHGRRPPRRGGEFSFRGVRVFGAPKSRGKKTQFLLPLSLSLSLSLSRARLLSPLSVSETTTGQGRRPRRRALDHLGAARH